MKTFLMPEKPTKPFLFCLLLSWASFNLYGWLEDAGLVGRWGVLHGCGLDFWIVASDSHRSWSPLHETIFLNASIWTTYFLVRSGYIRYALESPSKLDGQKDGSKGSGHERPTKEIGRQVDPRTGKGEPVHALLSFLLPGLGQLVQGRWSKGVSMFALAIVLWLFLLGWIVHIWSTIDAANWRRSFGSNPSDGAQEQG